MSDLRHLLFSWLTPEGVIAIGVLYSIWKMIIVTREARAARIAQGEATARAEHAARLASANASEAADHALATSQAIATVAENVQKIELATNSMKDALIESTKADYYAQGVKDEKERGG